MFLPDPASGLVGSLLSASCKLSFHLAKAHARFADWSYKCIGVGEDDKFGMRFTDEEHSAMTWHLKVVLKSLKCFLIIIFIYHTIEKLDFSSNFECGFSECVSFVRQTGYRKDYSSSRRGRKFSHA